MPLWVRRSRRKLTSRRSSEPGVCGLLGFWLYGMRPASHAGQEEYTKQLVELGFRAGEASPCCFYREADDVSCVVHGDDFTFEGSPGALKGITAALHKVSFVKVRATLGPEPTDDKEVSILNSGKMVRRLPGV